MSDYNFHVQDTGENPLHKATITVFESSGRRQTKETNRGHRHFWVSNSALVTVDFPNKERVEFNLTHRGDRTIYITMIGSSTPSPTPGPVIEGDWSSHFLASNQFFGPAIAARPIQEQEHYFQGLANKGYKTVLINAQQADWGPSKGHPEWTAGGFDVYRNNTMQELVDCILRARTRGLQVGLGAIDQPDLFQLNLDEIFSRSQLLVDATHHLVTFYMGSWELNEVWTNGGIREPNILEWVRQVDWKNRDFGIHYSPSLQGGINFYNALNNAYPNHVVRMMQYRAQAIDSELRDWTDTLSDGNPGVARVAAITGTKFCNFEHSSEKNQNPNYSEDDVIRRRNIIMDAASNAGLPLHRIGFMN